MDICDPNPSFDKDKRKIGFDFLQGDQACRGYVTGEALDELGADGVVEPSMAFKAAYINNWERLHRIASRKLNGGQNPPVVTAADIQS